MRTLNHLLLAGLLVILALVDHCFESAVRRLREDATLRHNDVRLMTKAAIEQLIKFFGQVS